MSQQASQKDLEQVEKLRKAYASMKDEIRKVIVGQDHVVDELFMALFCRGHCLLIGVPGLAKTLLISTLARVLSLSFNRIQFTPDLMPSDITGTEVIQEDKASGNREFKFLPGPIFANVILADEINRTPPKTQAALLEAMQEYQVTAGGDSLPLERPFFVLATQNPIELEGTYPLPEAQLDRFMFNIVIDYLPADDELEVALATTSRTESDLQTVLSGQDILRFQQLIKSVYVPRNVGKYAVDLVRASRPGTAEAPDFVTNWVSWGAGLRAAQYLLLGGKVRAVFRNRYNVSIEDIRALAKPVLRHRILTNFYAESEGVGVEDIIDRLLGFVDEPRSGLS